MTFAGRFSCLVSFEYAGSDNGRSRSVSLVWLIRSLYTVVPVLLFNVILAT